ncbi:MULTISPECIES: hypothetical protein [unclassified Pseudomonas]|uniref:hypothetical protein n=1 Tax=unclassified Pseudomonas TaxID=196821 RepID=UPI002AC9E041|nr:MULTISPECIES: hypothetical protein [unclassified Pseudomonas]MEB0044208.1 hypothetical protein [Pseudomonas sp. Dout3]MEB0094855.1 hypothetical protein [Pseudomonas sp. DC1.2]WPX59784.1 hypothetical protein RHM68_03825 [Pseudomonas sp. DC1.2]
MGPAPTFNTDMSIFDYEFTAVQRRTLDRYTNFLGSLAPIFDNIPVVFERRRSSGHQLAVLVKDSRINNAEFNARYLREFWVRTEETRRVCSHYVEDIATFARESLEITRQTSRNEPIAQVDFNFYSLSRSPAWMLFAPTNVRDLTHELYLRFDDLQGSIRQLKYTIREVNDESFGLKPVFTRAMDHVSCKCHPQPTVAQELFSQADTTPLWDMAYSSTVASVRAAEYKENIATLFAGYASVGAQMGLFIENIQQRMEDVTLELLQARGLSTLGQLNFKLGGVSQSAQACLAMLNQLEAWLRK